MMNFIKQKFFACLCLLMLVAPAAVVQAQTTQEIVVIFDTIIAENIPGQAFQKHSYLAFNGGEDGKKYYVGGIGDVRVSVDVKNDLVTYLNVQTDADLNPSLMPIMEKHFGEFVERKNSSLSSASIKATANMTNTKLESFSVLDLKYKLGIISAEAGFHGVVHTKSGKVFAEPYTNIHATTN